MTFRQVVVVVLLFAGVGVQVLCCLGLLLLRDAFDRLHCAGAVGFGGALICASIVVRDSFSLMGNKAAAIAVLLLFANPVLVHVTARMARIRAFGDWRVAPGEPVEAVDP
jgi:multisubunit Na+/H+ antiporter MnhG subunit